MKVTSPAAPSAVRHPRSSSLRVRRALQAVVFLGPFLVPFNLFFVAPLLYAIVQSTLVQERIGGVFGMEVLSFGGLAQYGTVLASDEFRGGLLRVIELAAIGVPFNIGNAILLALLLDAPAARGSRFFQLVFFAPIAVPVVVAAIIWGALLDPSTSPLSQAGIHINFLSAQLVLPSIANVGFWMYAGSNVVILIAALTAVPRDLFEAARLDGAREIRIAWSIKLPLIRPAVVFATVLTTIGALQLFTEPMLFRQLTPQVTSAYTPNMGAYYATLGNQYEYAAAVSVTMACITFAASFGFLAFLQRRLSS